MARVVCCIPGILQCQYSSLPQAVRDFLLTRSDVLSFLDNVYALVDNSIMVYSKRGFTHLVVFFGCTGGQYRSVDLVPGGYMWECPNLITLRDAVTGEDLDILIICPQGLEPVTTDTATHYASSDQCSYIVGKLDGTRFTVLRGFSELDHGQQFYARASVLPGH